MSKILLLSSLCLVILYISETNAQIRSKPPVSVRRVKKPIPPRVLNKVAPASRTRQQQMKLNQRKQSTKKPTFGHIKPATIKSYQDTDWCVETPLGVFIHEQCDMFWWCDEEGNLWDDYCPDDRPVFDYEYLECFSLEDGPLCWSDVDDGVWDAVCPDDPNEVFMLPGDNCDEYFVCISGISASFYCAPGQHFNPDMWYCDTPQNAQCDVSWNFFD